MRRWMRFLIYIVGGTVFLVSLWVMAAALGVYGG